MPDADRCMGLMLESAIKTLETMGVCCRAKEQTVPVSRLVRPHVILSDLFNLLRIAGSC